MHDTAYRIGGLVMETYLPATPASILEIGSQDVNGSLRDHAPRNAAYVGLDFEAGKGVDIVVTGLDDWTVPDAHFDLVMASSVFEHDKAFWQTFLVMCQKTKPGGHIYVSAPSNGTVHRYPQDYWRFYPDSGLALQDWARAQGFDIQMIESFICEREQDVWNDFSAVFRIGGSNAELNRDFVHAKVSATNVLTWRTSQVINPVEDSQDTRLLRDAREETQRWVRHSEHLNVLHAGEAQAWQEERIRLLAEQAKALEVEQLAVDRERQVAAAKVAQLEEQMRQAIEQERQQAFEIASRLAQRDEEAAQAWAAAERHAQERDQLASEREKLQRELTVANGWVERLALTRTQTERQAEIFRRTLTKLTKEFEEAKRQNQSLAGQLERLAARSAAIAEPQTPPAVFQPAPVLAEPRAAPDIAGRKPQVAPTEDSELAGLLDECHDEIAALGDMLANAQDRIAELEGQNQWLHQVGCFLLLRGKWWWRFMPRRWQLAKRDRRLKLRNLFDGEAYATRYPDVSSSGQDPFRHYLHHGLFENRRYD
ncbi:bifunctional 2-polyprenyl-6-hydroxyphenol methylase/3-demethylubiquinol 3-O-methyltransferase UbiG [Novosphingobium sp. FKTRR1]|uniref:class I SAM-dependent methyltransferase n=1 Tax=Novosphingobium sp. FKTRR1 TaxID=2879118 RepID=UPI001CF0BF26|nr:class I SAM-dependent methyltransferase [Novosphingobium sp. FKTRR1]